jgi:anti-sigma-K factor RskA
MTDAIGSFVAALALGAFVVFEARGGYEPLLAALEVAGAHHVRPRFAREERAIQLPRPSAGGENQDAISRC